MSTSYRFIGTTDDVLTCGHCGRAEQMARRDEVLRSRGIDPATATPREYLAALHEIWFTTSR